MESRYSLGVSTCESVNALGELALSRTSDAMGLSEYAASLVVGASRRWSLRWCKKVCVFFASVFFKLLNQLKVVHESVAAKANHRDPLPS